MLVAARSGQGGDFCYGEGTDQLYIFFLHVVHSSYNKCLMAEKLQILIKYCIFSVLAIQEEEKVGNFLHQEVAHFLPSPPPLPHHHILISILSQL